MVPFLLAVVKLVTCSREKKKKTRDESYMLSLYKGFPFPKSVLSLFTGALECNDYTNKRLRQVGGGSGGVGRGTAPTTITTGN